ncbi:putative ribosome-binding factor A, mitochondrial [Phascolarctos cinereus]|uniref:Glyoxylate reductase/hydroxypyruvate reductase n=1 Tax=Phascolarctos cinereus TaxID=38626 RepID=A0A6P5KAQ1_PHACI|nr:putative ribosome-binding factor A, mitochondrial isoform X1 [Phascolarctos cinereus]XP_020842547.1 putative ribosome-binding factor A, mitochondrial isoform X1 [Phascolarctos cinereus]
MQNQELPCVLISSFEGPYGVNEDHVEDLKKHFNLITMQEFLENKTHLSQKIQAIYIWGGKPHIDQELLQSLPTLKIIVNPGAGLDHLDLNMIASFGVKLANTPHAVTNSTADMGMALLLASARRILEGNEIATSPDTKHFSINWMGQEVTGSTLGIIGMGNIGYKIAQRAKGFEMKILYHNRNRRKVEEEQAVGAHYCAQLDELLQQSDFVMLAVSLTPQTHKLIGKRELGLMKPTASLVNIGRGQLVDQDALVEALQTGIIKTAGLDVTYPEPLPRSHPLLKLKNVILTPHIGSATHQSRRLMMENMVESLLAALSGLPIPNESPLFSSKESTVYLGVRFSVQWLSGKNHALGERGRMRKKFWYESPSLGPHLTHNTSSWENLTKHTSKKTRKEDSIRKRALDGILCRALSDLISTSEVNQDVYDLNVEFSKVSLAPDFSACRVYWKTSLSAEQNDHIETVLRRSASRFRHLLITHQILRNVPPVVFIRDKESAAIAEVNRLLEIADFGPPDEKDLTQSDPSECKASAASVSSHVSESTVQPSLFGINHEALHKQIMEYKRNKEKGHEGVSIGSAEQEREQVSMLQKQVKKKMKKAKRPKDDDITPQEYFLNRYDNQLDKDDTFFEECKPEYELQEALEKLELEDNSICEEQSSLTAGLGENKLKKC